MKAAPFCLALAVALLLQAGAPGLAQENPNPPIEPVGYEQTRDLAAQLYQAEEYDQAWQMAEKALELAPDSAEVRYLLGMILYKQYRFAEATPYFEPLAQAPGAWQAEAQDKLAYGWFFQGYQAEQNGDKAQALAHYQKAYPWYQAYLQQPDIPYDNQQLVKKKLTYIKHRYRKAFR